VGQHNKIGGITFGAALVFVGLNAVKHRNVARKRVTTQLR
jgi:hypothetical protein